MSAQDINFSQFYAVKSYYNPGFTITSKCTEFFLHSKYQFPNISGGFKTATLSYADYFPKINSGINFYIQNDISPQNIFNTLNFSLAYAYDIKIFRKVHFIPWIQTHYTQYNVNSQNIVVSSMINPITGEISGTPAVNFQTNRFIGLNVGYLLNAKNFFIGNSFIGYAQYNFSTLQTRKYVFSLAGISLKNRKHDIETYILNINLTYNQLGLIYKYKKIWFGTGGVFEKTTLAKINFDIGLKLDKMSYSFAYSIFPYKTLLSAYEFSIDFRLKCKNKTKWAIICPAYQL